MTSWLYFRQKQHTSYYTCKFPLFLKDDHLDLESLKKAASDLVTPGTTNNAWFNYFTCNHAPPPPHTHTLGICNFFFFRGLFPTPGYTGRDNSPRPSTWSTSYTIFSTSFSSVQKQNNTFSQLLWTFSYWVYWEKDNGCHNVVKTWRSASLIEHFMRTRSTGPNLCFSIDGIHSDIIKL